MSEVNLDLAIAVGSGVPVNFNGETLILQPLTLKDFGVIENYMRSKAPNIIKLAAEAAADLPEPLHSKIINEAIERAKKPLEINWMDMERWIDSREGVAFTTWMQLEKGYPGKYTLDQATDVFQKMRQDQIAELIKLRDESMGLRQPKKKEKAKTRRKAERQELSASDQSGNSSSTN